MKKVVCTVKDNKSFFTDLFTFDNEATAIRWFKDIVSSAGSVYFNNPEDFSLWKIATYDNSDSYIETLDSCCLCKAIDFRKEF